MNFHEFFDQKDRFDESNKQESQESFFFFFFFFFLKLTEKKPFRPLKKPVKFSIPIEISLLK